MSSPIEASSLITRSGDHISSHLDDELVVMSITSGKYYGLDPIAEQIWQLLEQPRNVGEICAWVLKRYQVGERQCESDIRALLQKMLRENLITLGPGKAKG